ncbi:MAG TPA: FkbM family methyltransferase [Acidimicrobiales bacterium]|nr:FkbM family methyltransferase [Acidimicrobiales bacterium]
MTRRILDPHGAVASVVRRVSSSVGWRVSRAPKSSFGVDPYRDMRQLSINPHSPVIIDAGANVGQTVHRLKALFPSSRIHSFEPSPTTYAQLCDNVRKYAGVHTSAAGLGSMQGEAQLLENSHSDMSSFLPLGPLAWGDVAMTTTVPIDTVDDYCERAGITAIDILKTDTQGFDLEVVKGAARLMASHQLHMVYMEVIFGAIYEGLPPADEVLHYMFEQGFRLVCFYEFHFQENLASWSDALFIDPSFAKAHAVSLQP